MNYLITGGCGFQGSHMAQYLASKGHFVRILNIKEPSAIDTAKRYLDGPEIIWGSVSDRDMLTRCMQGMDRVFHFGAVLNVEGTGTRQIIPEILPLQLRFPGIFEEAWAKYQENILGLKGVLQAAQTHGCIVNHISSAFVYGGGTAIPETSELRPTNAYAVSKACEEYLCTEFIEKGAKVKIIRTFNIYGERQRPSGLGSVIPSFFESAMRKRPLTMLGDGSQVRDILNIRDVIAGYALIDNKDALAGKAVNLASGKGIRIIDLCKRILSITGGNEDLIEFKEPRKGDVKELIADISLISSLGFKPLIDLDTGLELYHTWRSGQ